MVFSYEIEAPEGLTGGTVHACDLWQALRKVKASSGKRWRKHTRKICRESGHAEVLAYHCTSHAPEGAESYLTVSCRPFRQFRNVTTKHIED